MSDEVEKALSILGECEYLGELGHKAIEAITLVTAEVRRLREESERRNNSANAWNEKACELEREARRLREHTNHLAEQLTQALVQAKDANRLCEENEHWKHLAETRSNTSAARKLARVEAEIQSLYNGDERPITPYNAAARFEVALRDD